MVMRIVIVDDHPLVRAGIISLLGNVHDVQVVGEASSGEEALDVIAEQTPDIVFLDLILPGMSGLDVLARIRELKYRTSVIVLSMNGNAEYVRYALQAGAVGYVLKEALPDELVQAITAVRRGCLWFSSAISNKVLAHFSADQALPEVKPLLTTRQTQVLKLVAEGFSTKGISKKMNLSDKTIEAYRTQLMARLDIHDIAGLVRYAIREGIVTP